MGTDAIYANAGLLVAVLDLKLVQLIRGAMASADAATAKKCGCPGSVKPAAIFEPRRHFVPEVSYQPRPVVHPEPRYLPPTVIQSHAKIDPIPFAGSVSTPDEKSHLISPFLPPWKLVPWELPPQSIQKIKVFVPPPDINCRVSAIGSLLDCFI